MRTITTVTGEIAAGELGMTLAHEHLYCDISVQSGRADNIVTDVPLMIRELARFRAAGGCSIMEMTAEGIGRDCRQLCAISQASGVRIVSGIAFYTLDTWPAWARSATAEQIADRFVREIEEGTGGVRAGLIGELASHNEPLADPGAYRLTEPETRLFQAAALAQRRTGAAIATHASLGRAGHAQLDVLERAGADLRRVAIGHCDAHWHADAEKDLAYYLPILQRGACCSFDMIGWADFMPPEVRAKRLAALISLGFEKQLLLGSDTCRRSQLYANGGRGLDHVWRAFLPYLRGEGVSEAQIRSILVDAPRDLLAG